jgi:hypothetical protein
VGKRTHSAKDIHKEMFPVYGGKCLSRNAVHNWVDKFFQGRSKVADEARPGADLTETTFKRLLCCQFRRNGNAIGQVPKWRTCREINVFSRFTYHMFYVLYPFVTYLLTVPPNIMCQTFVIIQFFIIIWFVRLLPLRPLLTYCANLG